jgi:hypothetical protein
MYRHITVSSAGKHFFAAMTLLFVKAVPGQVSSILNTYKWQYNYVSSKPNIYGDTITYKASQTGRLKRELKKFSLPAIRAARQYFQKTRYL